MGPMRNYLLQQLTFAGPTTVVSLAGLVVALIFIRKYSLPAMLAALATVILLVSVLGASFGQAFVMNLRFQSVSSGFSSTNYAQISWLISFAAGLLRGLGIAILLAAVFVGRRPRLANTVDSRQAA